jgi:hypothetical protein
MRRTIRTTPARTAVSSKFDRYKPEEDQSVRKAEVKVLFGCLTAYVHDIRNIRLSRKPGVDGDYDCALWYVAYLEKKPNPADVTDLFAGLVSYQSHLRPRPVGLFLSIVINECEDSKFVFRIPRLEEPLDHIGYKNGRKIVVGGDVGDSAGCEMHSGQLVIEGNAGKDLGEGMRGGEIVIEGNTGDCCGGVRTVHHPHRGFDSESPEPTEIPMRGGKITVRGNAGKCLGEGMCGGEIHIGGEIGSIGNIIHGKIFHKGKLIVDE